VCTYQALSLLPPFDGEVYRSVEGAPFDAVEYAVGNRVKWSTFSVASRDWAHCSELVSRKTKSFGIVFLIHSRSGRDVSRFSMTPTDREVVFLPETTFKILTVMRPSVFALGQANIRQTYLAEDKDLQRAVKNQASIIVELQETIPGEEAAADDSGVTEVHV